MTKKTAPATAPGSDSKGSQDADNGWVVCCGFDAQVRISRDFANYKGQDASARQDPGPGAGDVASGIGSVFAVLGTIVSLIPEDTQDTSHMVIRIENKSNFIMQVSGIEPLALSASNLKAQWASTECSYEGILRLAASSIEVPGVILPGAYGNAEITFGNLGIATDTIFLTNELWPAVNIYLSTLPVDSDEGSTVNHWCVQVLGRRDRLPGESPTSDELLDEAIIPHIVNIFKYDFPMTILSVKNAIPNLDWWASPGNISVPDEGISGFMGIRPATFINTYWYNSEHKIAFTHDSSRADRKNHGLKITVTTPS
jgi:hypothetical protein